MPRSEFTRKTKQEALQRSRDVICHNCRMPFDRGYAICASRSAKPQFCSTDCKVADRKKRALENLSDRFWGRVSKKGIDDCWEWQGRKNERGYGMFDHGNKPRLASRFSYSLTKGHIDDNLFVCHSCDNPGCVNTMVTDEMIRVALLAFQSGDMDWSSQDEELMRFALEEALSAMPQPKPVTHLVWLQGRRAVDDVEDYYEVARPGDKCVDDSDPFPVYMHHPALSAQVQDVATHRHKKRGTQYVLIGVGKMQVENWCEFTTEVNHAEGREYAFAGKAVDMREVAIYRSVDDGSLWVRPVEEFNDGRFEPLPAAPAKQEG